MTYEAFLWARRGRGDEGTDLKKKKKLSMLDSSKYLENIGSEAWYIRIWRGETV